MESEILSIVLYIQACMNRRISSNDSSMSTTAVLRDLITILERIERAYACPSDMKDRVEERLHHAYTDRLGDDRLPIGFALCSFLHASRECTFFFHTSLVDRSISNVNKDSSHSE